MNNKLVSDLTKSFNRFWLKLRKHSPEILMVAGIAGTVTSAVMACKATTKLSEITDRAKNDIDTIHYAMNNPKTLPEEYTEEDGKKDLAIVYAKTGVNILKLYGPSVALGLLSITSILASNNILRMRNVAMSAAFMAVSSDFKDYRCRVVERFGEAIDKELRFNVKAKEVAEVSVDENGNETTVKTTVEVADSPSRYSDFTRCFDVGCTGWTKDPEMNLMFLRRQQDYANEMLKTKGHLFLNEVYDMLGFQRTKLGQIAGWVYENPNGDGYIDFGIYDIHDQTKRDFVNGYERSIWLDFNVDGNILDLI